jgi:hypothetical protein
MGTAMYDIAVHVNPATFEVSYGFTVGTSLFGMVAEFFGTVIDV